MKAKCPHCGFEADWPGRPRQILPSDGDLSFCPACSQWSLYELALRIPTLKEQRAITASKMCRDVEVEHRNHGRKP